MGYSTPSRSILTITLPSLSRNHHHCHRGCRPSHRHSSGASCTCCKLLRLLCRSTQTNSKVWCTDSEGSLQLQIRSSSSSVRGHFSSIGAKTKSDPMLIQIADLSATHYDPLARAVRQRLRALLSCSQRSSPPMPPSSDPSSADADADDRSSAPSPTSSGCDYSIPMPYSSEIPSDDVTLLPLANSELTTGTVDELAPLRDFHVDIFNLPMLGSLPALLDLNIATYVSRELTGRPVDRPTLARAPS
jgi:tRNA threonylcarbamoyladenosine dehydratase